jgi:hypothetical protein
MARWENNKAFGGLCLFQFNPFVSVSIVDTRAAGRIIPSKQAITMVTRNQTDVTETNGESLG